MEEIIDKKQYALLIDRYGVLLTAKQQELLAEHYYDDLSLSEIAENHQISKSAVYDAIKNAVENLKDYDKKLGLVAKEKIIADLLLKEQVSPAIIDKIKEILNNGI